MRTSREQFLAECNETITRNNLVQLFVVHPYGIDLGLIGVVESVTADSLTLQSNGRKESVEIDIRECIVDSDPRFCVGKKSWNIRDRDGFGWDLIDVESDQSAGLISSM